METYEYIEGYTIDEQYMDDMRFSLDFDTKQIEELVGQIIVKGERDSQYICFECPRHYDGVDLADTAKKIQVLYLTEHGNSDIVYAINAMKSENHIRFGWLLPASACAHAGKLYFAVEFCGTDYMLKTLSYTTQVEESLDDSIVPEPTEKSWYIEIKEQCDEVLEQAVSAKEAAEDSADEAATSATAAANIKNAVDETATELGDELEALSGSIDQIKTNRTNIGVLAARIEQALANYDASAETEIMDARVGHDGTVYPLLGDAIRGQFNQLRLYVDDSGYICQTDSSTS